MDYLNIALYSLSHSNYNYNYLFLYSMGNCTGNGNHNSNQFHLDQQYAHSHELLSKCHVLYDQLYGQNKQLNQHLGQSMKPQEIKQAHQMMKTALKKSFQQRKLRYIQKRKLKNEPVVQQSEFVNWGDNLKYKVQPIFYPKSFEDIQNFIKNLKSGSSVRAVGFRHSWSQIFSDPNQYMISILDNSWSSGYSIDVIWKVQKILWQHLDQQKNGFFYIGFHQHDSPNQRLVKFGAGVTNQEARRWCKQKLVSYPFNTILVQIAVVGAIGTCCHGSGIRNGVLCDIVYQIQFINCKGQIQKLNKKDNPELMKSASSSLGLLGVITHVTLEMQPMKHVSIKPRIVDLEKQIPRVGKGSEYQIAQFEKKCQMDYSEWFYFTRVRVANKKVVYANCWNKGEPIHLKCCQQLPQFPPFLLAAFQILFTQAARWIQNPARGLFHMLFASTVFRGLPTENIAYKACTVDAIHFQRGIQNVIVRDFQVEISIPYSKKQGKYLFDVVRTAFWIGIQTIQQFTNNQIDVALQTRILGGSQCTLASQNGYDATCSIEILRTPPLSIQVQNSWGKAIEVIFNKWKSIIYYDDNNQPQPVLIRPHWGKEWSKYEVIWNHLQKDHKFQSSVKKFQSDYRQIAKMGKWNPQVGKQMFSTKTFNRLIFDR